MPVPCYQKRPPLLTVVSHLRCVCRAKLCSVNPQHFCPIGEKSYNVPYKDRTKVRSTPSSLKGRNKAQPTPLSASSVPGPWVALGSALTFLDQNLFEVFPLYLDKMKTKHSSQQRGESDPRLPFNLCYIQCLATAANSSLLRLLGQMTAAHRRLLWSPSERAGLSLSLPSCLLCP